MGRGSGQSLASERCPAVVMKPKIRRQHSAQVTLTEDNDVIEAFAADRADDALDIGVLPRRSRRGDNLLDSHRFEAIAEDLTVRCVAIAQQKARRGIPGEGLGDLAR